MTEVDRIGPRVDQAVPFAGIQPGGGACLDLEARWRRLRRAALARLRPGYLRRMAAARTGACPGCAHAPIDPRDLKLVRPQCGHRWPDDDGFWRPRLGLARAGLAEVAVTVAACVAVAAAVAVTAVATGAWPVWLGLGPVAAVLAFGLHFFRDPERAVPADPAALLAPSDGVVTQVHTIDDPDFPGGRAVRVSVYLSPYDVHLNRVPRAARVTAIRYFPGRFVNARHRDCARVNEQLWVDLEEHDGRVVRVKQISGALARRLVCWLAVGEVVRAGVRYGMIKYGSRADVLVTPGPEVTVTVAVGDRVVAGQTVMMRFGEPRVIALYSRSYWDVLVDAPPALVAGGKGKVDAPSTVRAGGFAWNAARTLAGGAVAVRIVTVAPAGDGARLAAEVPAGATLELIAVDEPGWLPVTVVLEPGGACRILRDPGARLDPAWRADAISAATWAALVHVLGRLPAAFARDLVAAAHARGARVGWVGGADLPRAVEVALDLVCVNAREAAALIGDPAASVADCAHALAARAERADAVRVVTGGGGQATVAVHRVDGALAARAVAPAPIAPSEIRTLLGAGDAFAAAFMRVACLDPTGAARARLAVAEALAAGQAAARAIMIGAPAGG